MKRTLLPALLIALAAAGSATAAASADKSVARHLDKLGYTYEVDEDGDYRMVFDVEGDRTQMVYVRSAVEDFGSHNIREIWSPAYNAKTKQFPVAVANRLLEDSQDAKMGGLGKAGHHRHVRGQDRRRCHPGPAQRRHRCGHPHRRRDGAGADQEGRVLS